MKGGRPLLVTARIQQGFFATTRPVTKWLIRKGVRPNTITTVGAGLIVLSAVFFGLGWIRRGAALLLFTGVVDTLDGQVARETGQTSLFGAFYDSTLDRVADGATFIGIAAYFLTTPDIFLPVVGALACMIAVLSSLLVSYARARAEGLGLECKVGMVQRAERLIGIAAPSLFFGPGPNAKVLFGVVLILTIGSLLTVIQRVVYVYRVTHESPRGPAV